ncbi:hypothetical protein WN71_008615 [Streptomyces mangrovisoli]|uniref:Uncharacterized protein n=1 Tax=Streptomyces mangrovisoli TaxID=1428628 RepID=A0A1J4P2N4_9ACTN|nr:hypothetical protein WN71_008615 [Streptomyces mangrovisoli]
MDEDAAGTGDAEPAVDAEFAGAVADEDGAASAAGDAGEAVPMGLAEAVASHAVSGEIGRSLSSSSWTSPAVT